MLGSVRVAGGCACVTQVDDRSAIWLAVEEGAPVGFIAFARTRALRGASVWGSRSSPNRHGREDSGRRSSTPDCGGRQAMATSSVWAVTLVNTAASGTRCRRGTAATPATPRRPCRFDRQAVTPARRGDGLRRQGSQRWAHRGVQHLPWDRLVGRSGAFVPPRVRPRWTGPVAADLARLPMAQFGRFEASASPSSLPPGPYPCGRVFVSSHRVSARVDEATSEERTR